MKRRQALFSAVVSVILSAAGSAQTAASSPQPSLVGQEDRIFLTEAAQDALTEIQLARLAQQKASSEAVKRYAKMLEDDHTTANQELGEVAEERAVDLPKDMSPKQQATMERLQGLSGDQFDRAYIKVMMQDHKRDLKEFQRQAERSMDSDIRAFASRTVPSLQKHLMEVEQLANGKTAGARPRSAGRLRDDRSIQTTAQTNLAVRH